MLPATIGGVKVQRSASKECTLDKEEAGNTSFVSELNELRKNNSDVV